MSMRKGSLNRSTSAFNVNADVHDVMADIYGAFSEVIYAHVERQFHEHHVTGEVLLKIHTDADLLSCGLSDALVRYGDRAKILKLIEKHRANDQASWKSLTADQKVSHPCLILLSVLAFGILLVELSFVLVPLVMAMFFSYFLQPIVDALTERPMTCCGKDVCTDFCGASGKVLSKTRKAAAVQRCALAELALDI